MNRESLVVFTGWSKNAIEKEGGSGYWKAKADRIDEAEYVLLVRNQRESWASKNDGIDHGEAFLIGKIDRCVDAKTIDRKINDNRIFIKFTEYAHLPEDDDTFKEAWGLLTNGQRNPVAYLDTELMLEALDIDVNELDWLLADDDKSFEFEDDDDFDFDDFDDDMDFHTPRRNRRLGAAISQAKRIVADAAGVSPDDVTIDITF